MPPPRTIRIAVLGDSPCAQCIAACCKQNGHEFAVLLEGDERRRFAAFSMDVPIRQAGRTVIERVIPYKSGRCPFLAAADRCTIYEDRPANCRRFQCAPGYHFAGSDMHAHSEFLTRNPRVMGILDAL